MTEEKDIKRITDGIRSRIDILRRGGQLSILKEALGDVLCDPTRQATDEYQ
ncbi:hypothetical protein [Prevotella sp.]|uniref:hypothetical protein n=1 Tax=Prevotella sp. TaxID=59823 RepID=UPI003F7DDEE1